LAVERQTEIIKYKQSKKRCNLYVRNFSSDWTEQNITGIFRYFGEIDKIKLVKSFQNPYAFVCFKELDDAANAKVYLHNQTIDGKTLLISYYETKEERQINNEDLIDKADW
jgi:polyadenylate-binding protein